MTFSSPWPPRWRDLAAAVLGVGTALAQAPYGVWPMILVGFAGATWLLLQTRSLWGAFRVGWWFGAGYFLHALIWIVEPFLVDPMRHGWMAPFAIAFLAGGLALFWGGAFAMAHALCTGRRRAAALVVTLALAELARAFLLTGFPWTAPAQAWVGTGGALVLRWVGPHGLTVLTLAAACAPLALTGRWRLASSLTAALLAAVAIWGMQAVPPTQPTDVTVRIVQPNAAQHLKWHPDHVQRFFDRKLQATGAPGAQPDLIVWPETALPVLMDYAAPAFGQIAKAANGVPVALGIQRQDARDAYRNAMVVIGPDARPGAIYDKHHLVPFGEYVPLASVLGRLGLEGLATRAGGFAPGPGPKLVDFGTAGTGLPLICYEAVFPAHARARRGERPDFLIQLTNDAWFGQYSGPYQHLAQARMRAIEQGLPMIRAANTGVSAMIDPWGRITASLELGQAGHLDAALPARLAPTFYARTGDWPAASLIALLAAALIALRARKVAAVRH